MRAWVFRVIEFHHLGFTSPVSLDPSTICQIAEVTNTVRAWAGPNVIA